jgi:RNA-directed DNA polymerase
MNGPRESDSFVVPEKPSNKGSGAPQPAEEVEGRELAKGNSVERTRFRTQSRRDLQQALDRVRQVACRDKETRFTALWHHVYDVERLREAYQGVNRRGATGVDRVTWEQYGENLEDNLQDLSGRLERGAYRAKPVLRVYIPKGDGRQRPIGIPALEDKIVQRAAVEVLNAVYEADFLGFSYGFRPGRSQHNALDAVMVGIRKKKVNWVLDADIRGFFDAISHEWLVKFVEHRIADKRVVRHVKKWLKAGVLEKGEWKAVEEGTPQGGSVSPLLANIYLHHVFDLWIQWWRKTRAQGDVIVVRYADDFIVGFQHRHEAERCLGELRERFAKFNLELHPDKTRLIEFGRFADENRRGRGDGKPGDIRLSGIHAHVREDQEREVSGDPPHGGEEDASEAQGDQARASAQAAPLDSRGREVAGVSPSGLLPLLCRTGQPVQDGAIPPSDHAPLAAGAPTSKSENKGELGPNEASHPKLAAVSATHASISRAAPARLTRGRSPVR